MARIARKDLDGRHFHIMVQGIGKEDIFLEDNYKGFYLSCLARAKEKIPVKLLAFCVMDNHAHILLIVKDSVGLATYMRYANSEFAKYFNRIKNRVGYVFRDRFKSEVIKNELSLARCVAYIHNNPLKAGMVQRAEDYPFSSLRSYITGNGIVDFGEAANFFDVSPENMRAIMAERTDSTWLSHEIELENPYEVAKELLQSYGINNVNKSNKNDICEIALAINQRSGASIRQIAELLGVARETLRNWLVRHSD